MIEGGQINGSGGGVTSLNLLTGALELIAGTNIALDVGSNSITINATGVAAGVASFNTRTGVVIPEPGDYDFSQITGVNSVPKGGTGISSYTHGDLITALDNITLTTIAAVAPGSVLISNGIGAPPIYSPDPSVGSINLYNSINQMVWGTTNTMTFTMAAQTASHIFKLPNADSNSVQPRTITAGSAVQFIDNNGLQNLMVVIDQVLTGFIPTTGDLASTDTILQGFEKCQGNITALEPSVTPTSVNYSMVLSDYIIEVEANNLNITLLDATTVKVGKIYYVNNSNVTGTNVIPQGGQFINGSLTTWSINTPYNGAGFYSNGTGWRTI